VRARSIKEDVYDERTMKVRVLRQCFVRTYCNVLQMSLTNVRNQLTGYVRKLEYFEENSSLSTYIYCLIRALDILSKKFNVRNVFVGVLTKSNYV